jgi:hypothetical protein
MDWKGIQDSKMERKAEQLGKRYGVPSTAFLSAVAL